MATAPSGYSCSLTVAFTKWGRSGLGGMGRARSRHLTVLSLPTRRSSWTQSDLTPLAGSNRARSRCRPARARPRRRRCARRYRSRASQRLAASTDAIPASRSSFGKRSCKVRKARSERPRASRRIGRDMFDAELRQRPPDLRRRRPATPARPLWECGNSGCPDRCRASRTVHASQRLREGRESWRPCLLPRPGTPNRSRSSRHPASPPDRERRSQGRQPYMTRGVLVQHHAHHGPTRPLLAVRRALRRWLHTTRPYAA